MYIKYGGSCGKLGLVTSDRKRFYFNRNVWKDIPDKYADEILEKDNFISEHDYFFDKNIFHTANKTIALKRNCALGDLIQLIPIVHHLKSISNNRYVLLTQTQYVKVMKDFNVFDDVTDKIYEGIDKVIYLDGILELDHIKGNEECYMHRVKIYEKYFDINIEKHDFTVYNK